MRLTTTNVYGVIRCARNVRRRREMRGRCVRRVLWVLVALAAVLWLSGCERSQVDRGLMGGVLGLSTFLLVGLVVMAVTEQGRQDRLGEAYEEDLEGKNEGPVGCGRVKPTFVPPPPPPSADPMEAAVPGLDVKDLRRVLRACEVEARRVRELMASAQRTLSVDDHGDALRAGQDAQSMVIGCLQGLQERLTTANAEVCPPKERLNTANAEVCPPGGGL